MDTRPNTGRKSKGRVGESNGCKHNITETAVSETAKRKQKNHSNKNLNNNSNHQQHSNRKKDGGTNSQKCLSRDIKRTSITPDTRYSEYRYRESKKILVQRDRSLNTKFKTLKQTKKTSQIDNLKCINSSTDKIIPLNASSGTDDIESHNLGDLDKNNIYQSNVKLIAEPPYTNGTTYLKKLEDSQNLSDTVARTSTFDLNNNNNDGRTRIISNDIRKSVLHRISEISLNEDSECINKNHLSCQQSPSRQAWNETGTDQSDNGIDNLHQSECTIDNVNQSECTINEADDSIGGDIDERNQSECSIDSTHDLIGANSDDEFDTDIEEDFPEVEEEPLDPYGRTVYREECLRQQIIPITSFVKQLPEEKMTLKFRGFNEKASNALTSALSANSRIEICDLSNNNMGYTAGLRLVEVLKKNTFITHLDLSENQLGNAVGIKLGEMLLTNIYIKTLILKGNKFTNPVARIFAEVFKTNDTLVELDLSYNEFHENGSLYLGAGLALNESIKVLNLKWNSIRGKGGVAIAAAFSKNSTLKKLDLSWNGLAFIGCLAIGRHLKKNSTLEHLDISNNRIGRDGATKLVAALSVHPVLETFKIGLNPIGDEGVQKILKAMEKNCSINLLSFEKITICQKTLTMIENLQKSRDIEIITGGMGGFSKGKPPPGNMEVLVQFIQDNRMRLTDIFFRLDKDRNDKITKGEFVKGLMNAGLKMDKGQITNLIDQLDTNNDGDIEFSEILSGQQLVMNERRFQKKITKKTEQMEKDSIRLPKIHGF
eukprot:TCONS_00031185-protein